MIGLVKNSVISLLAAAVILLSGCGNTSTPVVSSPAQAPSQSTAQPAAQAGQSSSQQLGYGSSENASSNEKKTQEATINRVDVIYFHVNQRCVTCLCFEEHVNTVIEKYFGDAIGSGKLTYRVLNAQLPQNAAIAKKYGVVGSQLFINTINNNVDNIEDIAQIWNWNCRNNPAAFELKVKNAIEQRLNGKG
jgi:hypothetical protein